MKVLFVCTGNTCRSPMAEAVFNHIASEEELNDTAISRGISVFFPQRANSKALTALHTKGIELKDHRSMQISKEDLAGCDMALTMTSSHKMCLKSNFPEYKAKIYTLTEKAYGKDSDIEDPYGKDENAYLSALDSIYSAVREILCAK